MEKEVWLGWFPIYCNHLCFGEKHFTHPPGCACMCSCLFNAVTAHINRSETVFPVLNCRVQQGMSLALDLSVFTQTHTHIFQAFLILFLLISLCFHSYFLFVILFLLCPSNPALLFQSFLLASYLFPPFKHFDYFFPLSWTPLSTNTK